MVADNRHNLLAWVCERSGASSAEFAECIQSLWSGYGEIVRVQLNGASVSSVVLKHIDPPTETNHPRGWNTDRSHERKLRSYAVETAFYRDWGKRCGNSARVPHCLGSQDSEEHWVILLEDLDASGYGQRRDEVSERELDHCLRWLAEFHATFLGDEPRDLWPIGTYWHLATRPDELKAIPDRALRDAAPTLDARLNDCEFQTLVHGDAKLANFCFADKGLDVAAVDFQYVGGGCGIKDVAYFLSSCLNSRECATMADAKVDDYFGHLRRALSTRNKEAVTKEVETEWRALYPIAWADFYRFLAGWSPSHWKIHGYSEQLTSQVIAAL